MTLTPLRKIELALSIGLLLSGWAATPLASDDFASFRMTGVDGKIAIDYLNENDDANNNSFYNRYQQDQLRLSALVNAHSYLYHPKFIVLDISAGPIFQSLNLENTSNLSSTRSDDQATLYNFTTRATLLPGKPYSGSIYYDHLNPVESFGGQSIVNMTSERYGFDATLLAPVVPFPITLNAYRRHETGNNSTSVIDEQTQSINFRTSFNLLKFATTALTFQSIDLTSHSGSLSLPIQESTAKSNQFTIDTQASLGVASHTRIHNWINYSSQEYRQTLATTPRAEYLIVSLNANTTHRPGLTSFSDYNYARSTLGAIETSTHSLSLNGTWDVTKNLAFTGKVRADQTQATQYQTERKQLEATVRHTQPLPQGKLQTSYRVHYSINDQAANGLITVIGEHVLFNGLNTVALANPRVVLSSVQVWRLDRSQQYREFDGTTGDYTLTQVGQSTRIQRVAAGAIGPTEEVLIDYSYDIGGTYGSTDLNQDLDLTWAITPYASTYFRYTSNKPNVSSGSPSANTLNSVNSYLVGGRADFPFKLFNEPVMAGGFVEHEKRQETLAPYLRDAGEVYLLFDLLSMQNASLRLGSRVVRVDADTAAQTQDLTAYDLAINWRHYSGLVITLAGSTEKDTKGIEPRTRRYATLRSHWNYRKLTMVAELGHSSEEQGTYTRQRVTGRCTLQRNF